MSPGRLDKRGLQGGGLGGFHATPSIPASLEERALLKLLVQRKKLQMTLNLPFEEVIEGRLPFELYKFHRVPFRAVLM